VAALGELSRWCLRRSLAARPLPCYGAPSWTGFLPTGAAGCEELTKGVFSLQGDQSRMRGGEVQALTFGDGGGELQRTTHDKVGRNGCSAGSRSPTSG
jgi:hypothetical protein